MPKKQDIIKVHLHHPHNGQSDFYFRNLTALYAGLTSQVIGICRQALINTKFMEKRFYANQFCTIEVVILN
ncbi:MAG: hypothetical protein IJK84_00455 [Bacteroidales bacterium]|nr:hypothetical protein [Bacteroidales bacterium]